MLLYDKYLFFFSWKYFANSSLLVTDEGIQNTIIRKSLNILFHHQLLFSASSKKKKKKNNINLHLTVSSKSSKLFHPNASSPWTTRRDKSREYQIILYAYRGFHLSTAGPKSAWQRIWKERCSNRGCALQPWCMLQLVRAKGWCVASEICHPDVNQYFEGFAVGRPLNPLFWLSLTRNPTPCPACSALPTRRVPLADQRTDSCRWLPFSFPPPVLVFSQPPSQRWLISTRKLIRWEENLAACVDVAVQWSTPTDGKTAVD